ncbi:MAG: MucB/RseB C-terminal domain-containing protein [Gammaproteobacteria bacterium]|nr:MucB/RseB C-terminal domain-containing protein [Gammaproteobacteria bacterium]
MSPLGLPAPVSAICLLLISIPVYAAAEAQDWLIRINRAARELNYDGVFVYQHGAQLETMRILHRVVDGGVEERLVSLTGPAREVIRTEREVRCYLPDQKSVVVEPRRLNHKNFPAILPDQLPGIGENYVIELGRPARVVGRNVQRVLIRPRDDYRYGYQLWADDETGLLLKADITDSKGAVLEQFMFTQVNIGGDISPASLLPQTPTTELKWHRDTEVPTPSTESWRAMRLPKGFKLSRTVIRKMALGGRLVQQLVYTDGLAAVSVFVEKRSEHAEPIRELPTRVGALSAHSRPVDDHYATVVGAVPAKTITMISNSLVPAPGP